MSLQARFLFRTNEGLGLVGRGNPGSNHPTDRTFWATTRGLPTFFPHVPSLKSFCEAFLTSSLNPSKMSHRFC